MPAKAKSVQRALAELGPPEPGKAPSTEYILGLIRCVGLLGECLGEMADAALDLPGFQTVYPPCELRPKGPQKPVIDAPPVNRTDLIVQPEEAAIP